MKKKIRISFTLLMIMLLAITAVMASGSELQEEQEIPQHLTVASATHLSGNFFADLWGHNTSDLDVQSLLQGYDLVSWNEEEGMFVTDPSVVSGISVMENEDGDRTYLLTLYDDLYYSDGTPITAGDYAFSWLLLCSEEIGGLGVTPMDLDWIAGFQEYKNKELPYLTGLRILSEDSLMVIVRHEALPFFYELGLLSCVPYPIRQIAPGVRVFDDGYGAYLANDPDWTPEDGEEEEESAEAPRFTTQLLTETILDPETGYLSHPAVVSGPYVLTSWDGETAEFEKNTYYKGNAAGQGPTLDTLTYHCLANEDMIEELEHNETGLLNKVTDAQTILAGMELVSDQEFRMSNYARTGLTYISFSRIRETVASESVRKAIAWCMDRDEIMADYTGNFGLRTDGYFGIGQWMYRLAIGNLQPQLNKPETEDDAAAQAAYEAEQAAWDEISLDGLTVYDLNPESARTLLEEDGWSLNEDGVRERNGVVLDLVMAYPAESRIRETFEELLIPNLEQNGIRLTLLPLPMEELLELYYGQLMTGDDKTPEEEDGSPESIRPDQIDMFYLGSNFDILFEPEGLFAEYAPRQAALTGETIAGGYVFLDRAERKGRKAQEAAALLEQELSLAASHMDANANVFADAFLQEPEGPGAEETESQEASGTADPVISETEQLIMGLTEAAMGRIYEADEEALRLQMVNSYMDIYNSYIELYRDYGSIYVQALDMRETKPGEILEYMQKWVRFQELVNEYLPVIPVYSNVYFDFYISNLEGYDIARNTTWGGAVLGTRIVEPQEKPETETSPEEETSPAAGN